MDERCVVTGQIRGQPGDLDRVGPAPGGGAGYGRVDMRLASFWSEQVLGHAGAHRPRADRVDPDALPPVVEGHLLVSPISPCLAEVYAAPPPPAMNPEMEAV